MSFVLNFQLTSTVDNKKARYESMEMLRHNDTKLKSLLELRV